MAGIAIGAGKFLHPHTDRGGGWCWFRPGPARLITEGPRPEETIEAYACRFAIVVSLPVTEGT
jgi:hypothetical protein